MKRSGGVKTGLRLGLLVLALWAVLPVAGASALTNASIVAKAQAYRNGYHGGQCIVWVARVLREASGGRIRISAYASGYQGTYRANGGKQVSPAAATAGDVIQMTPAGTSDSWKGPEGNRPLHTAIILRNRGHGTFAVIDSNADYRERVSRHNFNPYARGGRRVKIWRFGSVAAGHKPASPVSTGGGSGSSPASQSGDSVGMYFPWDQTMHLRNSLSSGPSDYAFDYGAASNGVSGIPLVGDWDGDGKDSVGMYFPWDHSMHLRNSLSPGPSDYAFSYGTSYNGIEGVPLVGDWNGDGKDSVGMYFPWDQTMHLRNSLSSGPSDYAFDYGAASNGVSGVPLAGDWDGR